MKKPPMLLLPILLVSAHQDGWDALVAALSSQKGTVVLNSSLNATSFVTIQDPVNFVGQGHTLHSLNMSLIANTTMESLHVDGQISVLTGRLVMQDCNASGGGLRVESEAILERCDISRNSATDMGGGFEVRHGKLVMTDCQLTLNDAGGGSAGYVTGGELHVKRTLFESNEAFVGTLWIDDSTAFFEDCMFYGNTNQALGGGLFAGKGSRVTLTRCTFTSNVGGGAIYAVEGSFIDLERCTFTSNSAAIHDFSSTTGGQALYLRHATAYVYDSTFVNNTAYLDTGTSYFSYASSSIKDWSIHSAKQVIICNDRLGEDACEWVTTSTTILPPASVWVVTFDTVESVNEEVADAYEKGIERMLRTNVTLIDFDTNLVKLLVEYTSIDVQQEMNQALASGNLVFGGVRTLSVETRAAPTPKPESRDTHSSSATTDISLPVAAAATSIVVAIALCIFLFRLCRSSQENMSSSSKEASSHDSNEQCVDNGKSAKEKNEKENADDSIRLDLPDAIEVSDCEDDAQDDGFTPKSPRSLSSSRRTLGSPLSIASPRSIESYGSSKSSSDASNKTPVRVRRKSTWIESPKPTIRRSSTSGVASPSRLSPRRMSTSGETTPSRLRRMLTPRRGGSVEYSESSKGLIRKDSVFDDEEEPAVHSPLVGRRRRRRSRRVEAQDEEFPSDGGEDASSPATRRMSSGSSSSSSFESTS